MYVYYLSVYFGLRMTTSQMDLLLQRIENGMTSQKFLGDFDKIFLMLIKRIEEQTKFFPEGNEDPKISQHFTPPSSFWGSN